MAGLYWITLLASALSVAFCLGFRGLARQWHLIDIPNARKHHEGSVPLCGGIAIFLAFSITAFLIPATQPTQGAANFLSLLPGLFLILLTGVLDDRFSLPVAPRLVIQLLAACLILGLAGIDRLNLGLAPELLNTVSEPGSPFGNILTGPVFLLLALTFIVGLINAVNMSDGVDGLAASSSGASFFWLATISMTINESLFGWQALALMATCIGFLVFNMRHRWRAKASLFLGDGGSTFLGAALAGALLMLASRNTAIAFPVLLWIVIVPIIDTLSLIARRVYSRKSPFSADRLHLHHLLMDAGLSCSQTTVAVLMLNFACGAVAYIAIHLEISAWPMLLALSIPVFAHTIFVMRMTKAPRPIVAVTDAAQPNKSNITFPEATL